jgi:serine/threonine-protein kinase HipA
MKTLHVRYQGWGENWPLGTLADDGQQLLFEYSPQALVEGLSLSPRHLPLQKQAMGNFPAHQWRLPGLFADSLPDGWGMLLMDRLFRNQGLRPEQVSPLDRLSFIGHRCKARCPTL